MRINIINKNAMAVLDNPMWESYTLLRIWTENIDMEGKKLEFRFEKSEITLSSGFTLYSLDEIGEGAFGKIYLGVNNKTKEYVAIKLEIPNSIRSQLQIENKIYNILKGGGKNKNKNFYKNYK